MRAYPLKGTCITCQAPEPTRVAINSAIWTPEGRRYAEYISRARRVARESEVGSLGTYSKNAVMNHVEHVEATWRDVPLRGELIGAEQPLLTDFGTVIDSGSRIGMKAMTHLEQVLDREDAFLLLAPKDLISIGKLGIGAATARENSRLRRNQQAIDVAALFGISSGHIEASGPDEEAGDALEIDQLKRIVGEERRLITAARDEA